MENQLVEYIRKGRRRKKGMLIAGAMNGKIYIGYSLCSEDDKFSTNAARSIALHRATVLDSGRGVEKVPDTVRVAVRAFAKRCKKYYKGMPLPQWLETVEVIRAAHLVDLALEEDAREEERLKAAKSLDRLSHGA